MTTLEEKKGEDILLLDVHEITSFTDYFILCTATSSRMLEALSEAILEKVRQAFQKKTRPEGAAETGWVVLDYGDVVVHLFDPELRSYYNLEDLWREGKILVRLQ
ncbi:MAG: ribosome silencing factor [Anaerolineales bacterium]|nr:ribosome silencing factor [Anaerolineales bacterium]MCX7609429.1 ribosome silencing factor [Anaerolineales bacterium]